MSSLSPIKSPNSFDSSIQTMRPSTAIPRPPEKTGQLNRPTSATSNRITLPPLKNQSVLNLSKNEVVAEKTKDFVSSNSLPSINRPISSSNGMPNAFSGLTGKKLVSNKVMLEPLPVKDKASMTPSTHLDSVKDKIDTFVKNQEIGNKGLSELKDESEEEYSDDFEPEESLGSIPITSSSSPNINAVNQTTIVITPPVQSSSLTSGLTSPFAQRGGEIDQTYNTQRLASSLLEELHSHSLELPFKNNATNSHLSLSDSLDLSFAEHISKLSVEDEPFKPEAGANGVTRILDGIVIKAEDLDALKRQTNMNKILNHYKIKTPETHLLGQPALNALTKLSDFKVKMEEQLSEPQGAIVMAQVKGMTFGEILSKGVKSRKIPDLKEKNSVFDTFCSQIDRRMQELGHLAALDMLTGNTDRLVKTRFGSENPDGQLQSDPMINVGNWMYITNEGSGIKSPSHLGAMVPIDNSCFDYPYTDAEDIEKSKKTHVESFVNLMREPLKVAEHILQGFQFNLFEEYQLDLKNPESVFGKGVTTERLKENLEKGLKAGIQAIKSSIGDKEFFDQLINASDNSEQERLIYSTIQARAVGLKML